MAEAWLISMSRKLFFVILFLLLPCVITCAQDDRQLYYTALENARSGNRDFAFMNFCALLEQHPHSRYAREALFACGEYYFLISDYDDAFKALGQYVGDYPESREMPFVLMYILRIAKIKGEGALAKKIEKDIVMLRRLSFLFRDSKEYRYRSPLFRKHKAAYYIDKVEFYIDGELFEKISY